MTMDQKKRRFDDATGQIYYERTVKARSMLPKWSWRTRGKQQNPRSYKNAGLGASSLMSMAVRSTAWNMDRIGSDALGHIPEHTAKAVADYITSCETWSLATWETFIVAHREAAPYSCYKLDIPESEGASLEKLPSLSKHLSTLAFDNITRLNIRELGFTTNDLFQISKISNLELLDLQAQPRHNYNDDPDNPVFNDYFFSRWCRVVREEGKLSKLKVLILRQFDLTSAVLEYLAPFPALELCNIDSHAMRLDSNGSHTSRDGWECLARGPSRSEHKSDFLKLLTETYCSGYNNRPVMEELEQRWKASHKARTTHDILQYYNDGSINEPPSNVEDVNTTSRSRLPCISINYGPIKDTRGVVRGSRSSWYHKRALHDNAQGKGEVGDSLAESHARKRVKIGKGKRKAVGDLLGSFL